MDFTEFVKPDYPFVKQARVQVAERDEEGQYRTIASSREIDDVKKYLEKFEKEIMESLDRNSLGVDTNEIEIEFENGKTMCFFSSEWGTFLWR